MPTLSTWLQQVGFSRGNPFATKQANHEPEILQACFVEHPSFDRIARDQPPRSTILHAERGAGKTSACLMYEQLAFQERDLRRTLVVRLDDWPRMLKARKRSIEHQIDVYIQHVLQQALLSLIHYPVAVWWQAPSDPTLQQFWMWLLQTHASDLTQQEQTTFAQSGRLFAPDADLGQLSGPWQHQNHIALRWLIRALHATGFQQLVVLVDRIDETPLTVNNAVIGAELLQPLIADLPLLEMEGLVFKFFIPSQLVELWIQQGVLRSDRIACEALNWDQPELLRQVLQTRLDYFSDGRTNSLAACADPSLRDQLDDTLVAHAAGSPRRLLLLGEALFLARVADDSTDDLLIKPHHLAHVLRNLPPLTLSMAYPQTTAPHQPVPVTLPDPVTTLNTPALLRIDRDSTVYRGSVPLTASRELPPLQRAVLRYLFSKVGIACSYSELGREIWHDELIDEDTVRKVLSRLMKLLNPPEPATVIYLERRSGGLYVLQHAEPLPLDQEPRWETMKLPKTRSSGSN
ncbi:MAG: hypothetical protein AB4911_03435 [Oscillochloridaceae bacterium umkhey_bin13]